VTDRLFRPGEVAQHETGLAGARSCCKPIARQLARRRDWPGSEDFELLGARAIDGDRANKMGGRPWVDDRAVQTGMLFVLRVESPGACCRPRWDAARA
jgi:hypothetical protein